MQARPKRAGGSANGQPHVADGAASLRGCVRRAAVGVQETQRHTALTTEHGEQRVLYTVRLGTSDLTGAEARQ